MRRRTVAAVCLVAAVAVGVVYPRLDDDGRVLDVPGGVVLVGGDLGGSGMDALLPGRLALGPDGCLGLESPQGDVRVVVFPAGTSVASEDPLRIDVEGREYALGDEVEAGGGEIDWRPESFPLPTDAPKACTASKVFLMSQDQ